MKTTDDRPISVLRDADVYKVRVNTRNVLVLSEGARVELAAAIAAGTIGTSYNVAATDDGRPIHLTLPVDANDPAVITVQTRKVLKTDRANMELLGLALSSGEAGPVNESATGAALESTESPASPSQVPPPGSTGAGAPVGKVTAVPQREQSADTTEDAPAPVSPGLSLADLDPADFGYDFAAAGAALAERSLLTALMLGPELTPAEEHVLRNTVQLDKLDEEDFSMRTYRQRRSWSQVTDFEECSWCYYQKRVLKNVHEVPAWWNVGGTAVHAAFEDFEENRSLSAQLANPAAILVTRFLHHFEQFAQATEELSGVRRSEWRAAKKGVEDGDWWRATGVNMALVYAQQAETRQWTPLQMELDFTVDIDGVWFHGFIDRVDQDARGLWITDLKSGQPPKDHGQLIAYVMAFEAQTGETVAGARFYLTRSGQFTEFKREELAPYFKATRYRITTMDKAERAGLYIPRLGTWQGCSFLDDMREDSADA